jgi:hypothetical protein
MRTEAPVKVLKITGLGRSGSTILDIVLGNHPCVESVGEVMNLIRTGWVSRGSLRGIDQKRLRRPICTCGKRLDVPYVEDPDEACPFWSAVRREWVARADAEAIESYPKLQNDFEPKRRWPAPALREAPAVRRVPLVRRVDARVLRVRARGERETPRRRLFQICGTRVRPLDGARDRPACGPPGARRQRGYSLA